MSTSRNARGHRSDAMPSKRSVRPDDGNAFVPDVVGTVHPPLLSNDAESFAEEFVASATGAESVREDASDEVVDEEEGGPFIVLDEDAKLPPEPEERSPEREGHERVKREQSLRGARWAARGA